MFHVVLVEPEIPQNTGNIGRLCVGTKCKLHLVRPLGFSLEDRYMKRAGLDYWQHLQWAVHDSLDDCLQKIRPARVHLFSKRGTGTLWDRRFEPDDCLLFGRETKGLSDAVLTRFPNDVIRIPMLGPTRSINLANSVAVAVYEGLRQLHVRKMLD